MDEDGQEYLDMEEQKGWIADWLREKKTIAFIRNSFNKFLWHFKDDNGREVYDDRINDMVANDKQSLEVTYSHISVKMPTLAIWIAELPSGVLPILNQVAFDLIVELFPMFESLYKEVFIRIKDLPIEDNLRDLRQVHLNNLIWIKGVVTKRTGIFP